VAAVVLATAVATKPVSAQDFAHDTLGTEVTVKNITLHPNPKFLSCLSVAGARGADRYGSRDSRRSERYLGRRRQEFQTRFGVRHVHGAAEQSKAERNGGSGFTNFGMAWYQSDIETDDEGSFTTTIKTILLDQIFGFDPDQSNPAPINTFHLGFWFTIQRCERDGCTFDVTHPTPFNGEHNAGP